jgi:hypothetical protein
MKSKTLLSLLLPALVPFMGATAKADSFSTDFEGYAPGNISGVNGWVAQGNSPLSGSIVSSPLPAPAGVGGQVLQLNRVGAMTGVSNGLNSPVIAGAGESGILNGGIDTEGRNQFTASLWFATPSTPITHPTYSNFLQLNPSFKNSTDTASRYASVLLSNSDNSASGGLQIWSQSATSDTTPVDLLWGNWYRLDYTINFADGLNGSLANDTMTVAVYDASNVLIATIANFTWETNGEYRDGSYGGGTGPRQINGFDFIARGADDGVVGYVDNIGFSTPPVPEPSTIGLLALAAAGLTVYRLRSRRA